MSYVTNTAIGAEHQDWLKRLEFYRDEIEILRKRLAEVNDKNTSLDARAGVEHFQNQFIVQRNNIDELRHAINEHAHRAFEDARAHAGHIEDTLVTEHEKIGMDVKLFESVINDLRQEFNVFLTRWM